jgi:hypothetical protein
MFEDALARINSSWNEAPQVFDAREAAGDLTWQVDWQFLLYGKVVFSSSQCFGGARGRVARVG